MRYKECWIWLSRVQNIRKNLLYEVLKKIKIDELWNADRYKLMNLGFSIQEIDELLDIKYKNGLNNYIEYLNKNDIKLITIFDERYPEKLRNIFDPPIVLYAKGNVDLLNKLGIAVVGCRLSTNYGNNISTQFSYILSKYNINVISGLARGIDASSHMGALKANGNTIAVVGSGLDIIYPYENKYLFTEIIEKGGLIISEYVPGTKPLPKNFPQRNRIISGISNGVLVVEAKEKSGSLITVEFALEQGKEVYVVPGNINSKNSIGTNELIKQGAKMVTSVSEILEDFLKIF